MIWPFTAGLDFGQASENVPGPYDIAAYEREVYAVATNKAPVGRTAGWGASPPAFLSSAPSTKSPAGSDSIRSR